MPREVLVGYLEKFILRKSGEAPAQSSQGRGGITILGGAQEMYRCGTQRHSLVSMVVMGSQLDLMIFSNLDSMITRYKEAVRALSTPNIK